MSCRVIVISWCIVMHKLSGWYLLLYSWVTMHKVLCWHVLEYSCVVVVQEVSDRIIIGNWCIFVHSANKTH